MVNSQEVNISYISKYFLSTLLKFKSKKSYGCMDVSNASLGKDNFFMLS